MTLRIGELNVTYSSRGNPTYSLELWHEGLRKHRLIKGSDPDVVERKAELLAAEWESQEARRVEALERVTLREGGKHEAAQRTAEAQAMLTGLQNVLAHTLRVDDRIDWDSLKDFSPFPGRRPVPPVPSAPPTPEDIPREPLSSDRKYQPELGLLDKLISSRQEARLAACAAQFNRDHEAWQRQRDEIIERNVAQEREHVAAVERQKKAYEERLSRWVEAEAEYRREQEQQNAAIDRQREAYLSGSPDVVVDYCDMVLSNSQYPDFFPKEWELDYNSDTKLLVVDYSLPAPDSVPTLAEVRFVQSKSEFSEKHLSESQRSKLYDDLLYQVSLRTIHELFEADVVSAIELIVFNGWVTAVDRATGKEATSCVLSVQAKCDEFMAINLANVDPKACFKALKGVGSSKLHSMAAIPPIMRVRRDDGRFVAAQDVANQLDETFNLASMPWEDFEHLIREVFAQEFSKAGGEVKVTRASRDGGVDAVAFDPDPIRGGKIVIQAKRYTNTVGVAAVRDLYGTVMNEGATKGILVTTSDYGPDAYEFANGKPLTLLNGANLLYLLERHGHKAKIDLKEARELSMRQPGPV